MSLDNNCRKDKSGNLLPHYSPRPTLNSSGIKVFTQPLPFEQMFNVYVFLPFVPVSPLLRFFFDQHQYFAFIIIVPRLHLHRYWWAILQAIERDSLLLGKRGDLAFSIPHLPEVNRKASTMGFVGFPWRLFSVTFSCTLFLPG